MKKLSILGSTGSIGTQTLDIVRAYKEEFKIAALAVNSSIDLLEKQIREFKPELVCVYQEKEAMELKSRLGDMMVRIASGMDGLIECAVIASADTVVTAMVGMIGIRPTIEAINAGKNIALANKETLVTAGHIIMPLIKEKNVRLLPVDSEHCAIFQSLNGEDKRRAYKILLTASGGPFRGKSLKELMKVLPSDALKHPNWSMGRKITIDSATMVNKGLEVLEAAWLFDMELASIQVVVHPQSIIHSMVEYIDGSIIAQMGVPDMKLPIQYALFYPCRKPLLQGERVDFYKLSQLTFEAPDMDTFYGLRLAYEAGRIGGSMPTVYNAANEFAVAQFLAGRISFTNISELIKEAMKQHKLIQKPQLKEILNTERQTYDFIKGLTKS